MAERKTDYGMGYVRDSLDPRDHLFGITHAPLTLPPQKSLREAMPPVYDQGQLGSCTGNAIAAAMEYQEISQGEGSNTPSRLFIYYHERLLEGTVNDDSGAQIRDGLKVVAGTGVPPETDWPYDIGRFTEAPPALAETDAAQHTALEYASVQPSAPGEPIRAAIAAGYPVVFGFSVPQEFEELKKDYPVLEVPGPNASFIGGHAVLIVGYDFTRTTVHTDVFEVRNSWGPSWGEAGYFYMEAGWMTNANLTDDFWVVRKVK